MCNVPGFRSAGHIYCRHENVCEHSSYAKCKFCTICTNNQGTSSQIQKHSYHLCGALVFLQYWLSEMGFIDVHGSLSSPTRHDYNHVRTLSVFHNPHGCVGAAIPQKEIHIMVLEGHFT